MAKPLYKPYSSDTDTDSDSDSTDSSDYSSDDSLEGYRNLAALAAGLAANTILDPNINTDVPPPEPTIGYIYDEDRDAFIPKKPFNSWILNEDTCRWKAPVAMPTDSGRYKWNETNLTWDIIE